MRYSLISILINYLQERSIVVKWHGKKSKQLPTNGGGPQGGYLGNLEHLAQSNQSADCVPDDSRFKFVDDLTVLEKVFILMAGLASHNVKSQVPNDILMYKLFIPKENLNSQSYLNQIERWTEDQKMKLNTNKTKCMIFNFTKSKQFSPCLTLKNTELETVKEMELLGTIISDDLKWNKNTLNLVKKAYSRMELLRQIKCFTKSTADKLHINKTYIRNNLEQFCVVWGSKESSKDSSKFNIK